MQRSVEFVGGCRDLKSVLIPARFYNNCWFSIESTSGCSNFHLESSERYFSSSSIISLINLRAPYGKHASGGINSLLQQNYSNVWEHFHLSSVIWKNEIYSLFRSLGVIKKGKRWEGKTIWANKGGVQELIRLSEKRGKNWVGLEAIWH